MLRRRTVLTKGAVVLGLMLMFLPQNASGKGGLFDHSMTITTGLYAAEGFGSNLYVGGRYNHYFEKWKYFVETSVGYSSLRSQVLKDLANFQVFDTENLWTYEFIMGYDMAPLRNFPYLLTGVAGISQGGQFKFAYVIGLGKQIPLAQFFKVKRLGIRYDIRDQIFKQQVTNTAKAFIAHNLIFTVGLQYYF
ncbi:MAG: hypothetical protein AAFP70_17745 [Calditrichota bacterium]